MRNDVLILVNAMHITASAYINDNERGLLADYEDWLEAYAVAPHEPTSRYRHSRNGETCPACTRAAGTSERSRRDNADAHLKRQIIGRDA